MYPKEYFYKKIVVAKLYMDNNYGENIDIQNIASEAHFSKFDFIRQFKRTYGRTPYNYLKMVRLNKAVKLLASPNLSVKDVCFMIGYDSISSFSGLFKREFGAPPKEFQVNLHKRASLIQQQPLQYIPGCFAESNGWKRAIMKKSKNL